MRLFLLPLLTLTLAASAQTAQTPQASEAPAKPVQATPAQAAPAPEQAAPAEAVVAPEAEAPAPAEPARKPGKPVAAKPKEDKVLARINGQVIRESDFDMYVGLAYNDQQRMQIAMVQGAREQLQNQFLQAKLLEAKARKEHLDAGGEYAKRRSFMEMDILVRALFERDGDALRKQLDLKDEDFKAYYESHKDRFQTKETFDARHILIGVKGSPAAGDKGLTDEEAKAKIAKLQAELKAGKKFEDLTKEYSDDPGSKEKGGLYENIAFGSFTPEFEEAVRKQPAGQVGEPVKTPFGYHIIQVEKITPAHLPPFEEVKAEVQKAATQERQEQVMKVYIDAAKKEIPYIDGPEAAKAPAPARKGAAKPKKSAGGAAK